MNKEIYTITRDDFKIFLSGLSEKSDVYVPVKSGEQTHYRKFSPEFKGEYTAGGIRAAEPIKSFLTRSRERVDTLPEQRRSTGQVLVGVKNCDISSLAIQDFVFGETDPKDPFYINRRENTAIISSDCDFLHENCFCTALGLNPYPEKGFDLNLSLDGDDIIAEVGSDKGRGMVKNNRRLFTEAPEPLLSAMADRRKKFRKRLEEQAAKNGMPGKESIKGSIKKSFGDTGMWERFASTCIECGGCNHCCPACHCFFLSDEKEGGLKARYKSWDACLYNSFARVAGGATPRKHLYERLRNRFDKKFEFFPNVLGAFGCTGCGRCIEACPGKIDIREVLKSASKED